MVERVFVCFDDGLIGEYTAYSDAMIAVQLDGGTLVWYTPLVGRWAYITVGKAVLI